MRRTITTLTILLACAGIIIAQANYAETLKKANRFFDNQEWASASALYNFALKEKPSEAYAYGRAIVSVEQLGDTAQAMHLLQQAMTYGVSLDSLLSNVKRASFDVGHGHMYENFMLEAASEFPWLGRPLDAHLLKYYAFRRNGPQMVAYANKMLNGAPGNTQFLSILAQGYMIDSQTEQAAEAWKRILQTDPDNYDALLYLGNMYAMAHDATAALPYLERAQSLRATPYLSHLIWCLKGAAKH